MVIKHDNHKDGLAFQPTAECCAWPNSCHVSRFAPQLSSNTVCLQSFLERSILQEQLGFVSTHCLSLSVDAAGQLTGICPPTWYLWCYFSGRTGSLVCCCRDCKCTLSLSPNFSGFMIRAVKYRMVLKFHYGQHLKHLCRATLGFYQGHLTA